MRQGGTSVLRRRVHLGAGHVVPSAAAALVGVGAGRGPLSVVYDGTAALERPCRRRAVVRVVATPGPAPALVGLAVVDAARKAGIILHQDRLGRGVEGGKEEEDSNEAHNTCLSSWSFLTITALGITIFGFLPGTL
jgi:hypothetical protein